MLLNSGSQAAPFVPLPAPPDLIVRDARLPSRDPDCEPEGLA
jgi:hypothetical protein